MFHYDLLSILLSISQIQLDVPQFRRRSRFDAPQRLPLTTHRHRSNRTIGLGRDRIYLMQFSTNPTCILIAVGTVSFKWILNSNRSRQRYLSQLFPGLDFYFNSFSVDVCRFSLLLAQIGSALSSIERIKHRPLGSKWKWLFAQSLQNTKRNRLEIIRWCSSEDGKRGERTDEDQSLSFIDQFKWKKRWSK